MFPAGEKLESHDMAKNWIAAATRNKGAFTKKAQNAGMSVQAYAKHVSAAGSKASTRTKRQAALARTLSKMSKGR